MKRIEYARRARLAVVVATIITIFGAMLDRVESADRVRYVVRTETGEFEERDLEGKLTSMTEDELTFQVDDDKRPEGAPEDGVVPAERVLWIMLDGAPINLDAARVEIEIGEYENALERLNALKENEIDPDRKPRVAAEVEWYKAYATLQLALADAQSITAGGKATADFIKAHGDHYRYYAAIAMLGDAYLHMARNGSGAEKESSLKRAKSAYAKLEKAQSAITRARGKLGLARVAVEEKDPATAEPLFAEIAKDAELVNELHGLEVVVAAKLGLAGVYANSSRFAEARTLLDETLASTPNSATLQQAQIYNAIGDARALEGATEEAIVAYLHVDLLYPSARHERVKALKALAPLWRKVGRDDRADETVERLKTRFNVKAE